MNTMVLLPIPLAPDDADVSAKCQMTEKHFVSHFDYLELANAMVLLMMTLVSCDANTDITRQRSLVVTCVNHLD